MRFTLLFAVCLLASAQDSQRLHTYHLDTLKLDCATCHRPVQPGSVTLRRPAHSECIKCHPSAFRPGRVLTAHEQSICAECHTKGAAHRPLLTDFSHARHMDGKARLNAQTGFRADCIFCHQPQPGAALMPLPGHTECAACHSRVGFTPHLAPDSKTHDCQGCHTPASPAPPVQLSYTDIRFSHANHAFNCTGCHASIPASAHLVSLQLPQMLSCVPCHDSPRNVAAQFRLSNCASCHIEPLAGPLPPSHNRNVMPPSHTENFRQHHAEQASSPSGNCYACHLNVQPTGTRTDPCFACHQVMRPVSHTARWKDDLHGKFAALDRTVCATCHAAETCVRCHNELPRSHAPLPLFKNGGHAVLAMVNERACLTCHTFQNTCASCHIRNLH